MLTILLFQLICDADMMIVNCVAKWPGSVPDARILRESALFTAFESDRKPLNGVFLGHDGYLIRDWLLTPIVNPRDAREEAYTSAHCTTRSTVDRCIDVLKRRWRCLRGEIRLHPKKVCRVICACVMLHNRATQLGLPPPPEDIDPEPQPEDNAPQPEDNPPVDGGVGLVDGGVSLDDRGVGLVDGGVGLVDGGVGLFNEDIPPVDEGVGLVELQRVVFTAAEVARNTLIHDYF